MSPAYQSNQRHNPEDAIGILILGLCLVVGLCWYIAVSRLQLRNDQCLELFLYFMIGVFGVLVLGSHFVGRRRKREDNWPHPPLSISGEKDMKMLKAAQESASTLLGYNVHNEPCYWPDEVRAKHGILVGGTGAGKTTTLMNIIRQDVRRTYNGRKMPMIILNGKGDNDFERAVVAAVEGAGRMQDLRIVNPSRPLESSSYNPFYAIDDNYQEHVNFIFRSFGLREDFFSGHQEAYLSDIVRILFYTGKRFNVYDVMVMALDEKVLSDQITLARDRVAGMEGISAQQRRNFDMSVRMIARSLEDRERVEKIQGLLNELLAFLEDDLSIITGAYQDLLTLDDVLDRDLILLVSLNVNANERAVQALGRIILQNLRLMVGKRYSREPGPGQAAEPMVAVILDEIEAFAFPGFANILQTARGARISITFSFQMLSQLVHVGNAFAEEVSAAPRTKMIMNVSEESTVQWFMKASARVPTKRRSLAVRKTGLFSKKYVETGTGSESEIKETRAREDQIKNLPVGQMQILMDDPREGTKYSHLLVRRDPAWELPGMAPRPYPKMHSWIDPTIGAHLRFSEKENRKKRRRRTIGAVLGEQL
ncbi:MAG TPA: type IV secretory system conjugative DNA transfer family protein [Acidobacteriaceae bacterium]